jgi:hypothetical protein
VVHDKGMVKFCIKCFFLCLQKYDKSKKIWDCIAQIWSVRILSHSIIHVEIYSLVILQTSLHKLEHFKSSGLQKFFQRLLVFVDCVKFWSHVVTGQGS